MSIEIMVPSVGESIRTGILSAWLKDDGAGVEEGEELFELETDKATVAFPSPRSGRLKILVAAGAEVEIGQLVGELAEGSAAVGAEGAEVEVSAAESVVPALSPAVRKLVRDENLDAGALEGTGKKGRVTKADVERALTERDAKVSSSVPAAPPAVSEPPRAAEPPAAPVVAMPVVQVPTLVPASERLPMSSIRKRTAERLVQAQREAAYLTTFNEIDMAAVSQIRAQRKDEFEKQHGVRLGFMSFFVKACCMALKKYPKINSMIDGDDIVLHHVCNIGIAVSMESGLIVPVLRQADRLTFAQVEQSIVSLAGRAKEKKLLPDELTGGTFSITNGGVFGSLMSTPIPAYPQAAILGMHAIKKRPVAAGDEVVVRPMMYVALTYDHRIVDGREAIGFLAQVKAFIEAPDRLLLEM